MPLNIVINGLSEGDRVLHHPLHDLDDLGHGLLDPSPELAHEGALCPLDPLIDEGCNQFHQDIILLSLIPFKYITK